MKGNRSLRKGKKLSAGTEAATKGIPSPANSWSMASYSAWNTQHINRNNQYGGKKEIKTSQTRIVTFDCIVFKSGPQKTLKLLDQDRYFHSKNSALCWSSLLFDLQHLLVFIISFITTAVLTRGLRRQRKQQEKKKWKAFKAQFILSKTICDKWVLANKTIHHPHPHLFLEHIADGMADLLQAGRVFENLLFAGLDDTIHAFQDTHHNMTLGLPSHRFQKAGNHYIQQLQQGWVWDKRCAETSKKKVKMYEKQWRWFLLYTKSTFLSWNWI